MPCSVYRASSNLSRAFDELLLETVVLDRAWTCERERSGLRCAAADVRHHVCAAINALEALDRGVSGMPSFDQLDDAARVYAREAFLSVLTFGQLLRRAHEDELASVAAIATARLAIDRVLDELSPHVSSADDALRQILLDDVPFETALAGVARGP